MANLVLLQYPSGGFGHTLFHALTQFSAQTHKPPTGSFHFSPTGDGHSANIYTEKYLFHPREYDPKIPDTDKTVLILCDNGITDDDINPVIEKFPGSKILRMVIDLDVRPVIYQTCVYKAEKSTVLEGAQAIVNKNWSEGCEDYAIREHFSLFYHSWNFGWDPVQHPDVINVSLQNLIDDPKSCITNIVENLGHQVINQSELSEFCEQWLTANEQYFRVYRNWQQISRNLDDRIHADLDHITDLHDQGYLNYCIEQRFNVTIPVYDYRNWFKSTSDILLMVQDVQNKNTNS